MAAFDSPFLVFRTACAPYCNPLCQDDPRMFAGSAAFTTWTIRAGRGKMGWWSRNDIPDSSFQIPDSRSRRWDCLPERTADEGLSSPRVRRTRCAQVRGDPELDSWPGTGPGPPPRRLAQLPGPPDLPGRLQPQVEASADPAVRRRR